MAELLLLVAGLSALAWSLLSRRAEAWPVTGPMVFLLLGWALSQVPGAPMLEAESGLHLLAEVTLIIVLFADAANVDVRALQRMHAWPVRMLVVGLPLAILLGFLPGLALLGDWGVWEVAMLAAILAPTDAALGQAVVTNLRVPERVRRSLVVESGLNDGLALPAVLMFGCFAVAGNHEFGQVSWVQFALEQIGLGALAGIGVGALGGLALARAHRLGLSAVALEGIGILAVAGLCYLSAQLIGGNGFLATFVGGMAYRLTSGSTPTYLSEFMETEGALLVLATFFLTGFVLVPHALAHAELAFVVLVLVSLFAVRPVAIWASLSGSDAPAAARGFMGWFGPRGLATLLFALMIVGELSNLRHGDEILVIATLAVLASTVLHGLSAAPLARRFGPGLLDAKRVDAKQ